VKYRNCSPQERQSCELQCGSKGVLKFDVTQTFRLVRLKEVGEGGGWFEARKWVDANTPNCSCNDDDDEPYCKQNPMTCAGALILGVCILTAVLPAIGPILAPALP
jgi:hypothetical protein